MITAVRRTTPRFFKNRKIFLHSFWWNRCMPHREALLGLEASAPKLLPYLGELIMPGAEIQPGSNYLELLRGKLDDGSLDDLAWLRLRQERAQPVWKQWYADRITSRSGLATALRTWARARDSPGSSSMASGEAGAIQNIAHPPLTSARTGMLLMGSLAMSKN
jgi:hypothetical protein